jgi:peroxiredoxin
MASNKQKTMLSVGDLAPNFDLDALSGGRRTLLAVSAGRPALLAFYKVSCPTCQYTLPFLERLHRGRSGQEIAMCAISQDDAESTREFDSEFGITLPTLLDQEEEGYPASNAYGLSNVPSIFLVEPDRKISLALMGFDKKGLEALGRRLGKDPFEPGESVPEWRPG